MTTHQPAPLTEQSRVMTILALNAWIQLRDSIIVLRCADECYDIESVALDGSAYTRDGAFSERAVTDDELAQMAAFCKEFLAARRLDDGRLLAIVPLLHGYAHLGISSPPPFQNERDFADMWQYEKQDDAIEAFHQWSPGQDPEPPGWVKHPHSGRRRPGGVIAMEHQEGEVAP